MIANATIASKTEISAPELLWTNPNPTAAFAAQNVTVSGDYDGYIVEVVYNSTSSEYNQYPQQIYVPKIVNASTRPKGFFLTVTSYYTGSTIVLTPKSRQINSLNNGTFNFGAGKSHADGSSSTDNASAVPTRIWGVKWSL